MIADLMALKTISPVTRTIVTCAAYARQDLEDTCFLKCADAGRGMKSECVSEVAPQAISWDWRLK